VFLCPADGGPFSESGNNYRGNVGVGMYAWTSALHPDSGNGFFSEMADTRDAQIVDGLSHTIAFSERLRGSGRVPGSPERDAWPMRTGVLYDADDLILACKISARSEYAAQAFTSSGDSWFWQGRDRTFYNHAQTPDGKVPDCLHGYVRPPLGMCTARSQHRGGVNCLLGDGATRVVSESVTQPVWRALGTRNGSELVE
jgi:hypothetical protein